MARSKFMFDIEPLVKACLASEEKNGEGTTYSDVFEIDFNSQRKAGKVENLYITLYATDINGVRAPLRVKVKDCKSFASITPLLQADVNEVNERMSNKGWEPKSCRDMKPAVTMQMYQDPNHQPKTVSEDSPEPVMVDGKPVLPPADKRHPLVYIMSCLNKYFLVTVGKKIAEKEIGEIPMPGDPPLAPNAIQCKSVKRFAILQDRVKKGKNAGKLLANPLVRVDIGIPNTTDATQGPKKGITYYDKKKPYLHNGETRYEILVDENGSTINAGNVHKLITAGSTIEGVVSLDSICFSSLGISIGKEFSLAVVDTAEYGASLTQDDYFASAPPTAAASTSAVSKPETETISEDDLAALMQGVSSD